MTYDPAPQQIDPRGSTLPLAAAFLGGLLIHTLDQALYFRAGVILILVIAPTVGVCAYGYSRPGTSVRRLLALAGGGSLGSGLALLGVYLHGVSYQLPRPMSEPEMLVYDLGLFIWFVASLTAAYALATQSAIGNRRALAAIVLGPLLQLAWIPLIPLLVTAGRYS